MQSFYKPLNCWKWKPEMPRIQKSQLIRTDYDLSCFDIWDKVWPLTVWTDNNFNKILLYINPNINY